MRKRFTFEKSIAALAAMLGVSFGLCGLTGVAVSALRGSHAIIAAVLLVLGFVEWMAILVSTFGLAMMGVIWVFRLLNGNYGADPELQKLFDEEDRDGLL
jgi:hypothetical protein